MQLLAPPDPDLGAGDDLVGGARPSPAGPLEPGDALGLPLPPMVRLPRVAVVVWFGQWQASYVSGLAGATADDPRGGHMDSDPDAGRRG